MLRLKTKTVRGRERSQRLSKHKLGTRLIPALRTKYRALFNEELISFKIWRRTPTNGDVVRCFYESNLTRLRRTVDQRQREYLPTTFPYKIYLDEQYSYSEQWDWVHKTCRYPCRIMGSATGWPPGWPTGFLIGFTDPSDLAMYLLTWAS